MWIKVEPVTVEEIGRAINRLRFKTHIYKAKADNDRVFIMVQDVQKICGLPLMTREQFDERIHAYGIFAPDYRVAMEEFRHLCAGDW